MAISFMSAGTKPTARFLAAAMLLGSLTACVKPPVAAPPPPIDDTRNPPMCPGDPRCRD